MSRYYYYLFIIIISWRCIVRYTMSWKWQATKVFKELSCDKVSIIGLVFHLANKLCCCCLQLHESYQLVALSAGLSMVVLHILQVFSTTTTLLEPYVPPPLNYLQFPAIIFHLTHVLFAFLVMCIRVDLGIAIGMVRVTRVYDIHSFIKTVKTVDKTQLRYI